MLWVVISFLLLLIGASIHFYVYMGDQTVELNAAEIATKLKQADQHLKLLNE